MRPHEALGHGQVRSLVCRDGVCLHTGSAWRARRARVAHAPRRRGRSASPHERRRRPPRHRGRPWRRRRHTTGRGGGLGDHCRRGRGAQRRVHGRRVRRSTRLFRGRWPRGRADRPPRRADAGRALFWAGLQAGPARALGAPRAVDRRAPRLCDSGPEAGHHRRTADQARVHIRARGARTLLALGVALWPHRRAARHGRLRRRRWRRLERGRRCGGCVADACD